MTLVRGTEWGAVTLRQLWGVSMVNPDLCTKLCDLAVAHFHAICAEHGRPDVRWLPQTGEVIGNHAIPISADQLHSWRLKAEDDVWEMLMGGITA